MNAACSTLCPLVLTPSYKDYIWGGSRIPTVFSRTVPAGIYAESWEVSDRPEGPSTVEGGPFDGVALSDLVARCGAALAGVAGAAGFPLLVKLIDARERLSIQVHPDDGAAARGLGEAKTEAWHILDAPKGACVYAGLKAGIGPRELETAIREQNLVSCLNAIPVSTGDTIFIPGGRVHAIGEGLLILEVQQNSNTTFRVYDWGRTCKDGRPRELHVDQALQVIRWHDPLPVKVARGKPDLESGARVTDLVTCPYFQLEELELDAAMSVRHGGTSFHALFALDAPLDVRAGASVVRIPAGRTGLIPACLTGYTLTPPHGRARALRIRVPVSG